MPVIRTKIKYLRSKLIDKPKKKSARPISVLSLDFSAKIRRKEVGATLGAARDAEEEIRIDR